MKMQIPKTAIPWLVVLAVGVVALFTTFIPRHLSAEPLACNSTGFVITGADANWCESTTSVPTAFSSLLDLVTARVSTDYARAHYRTALTTVPDPLNSNLALVASHIGLDYARANQRVPLTFPVDIVNDTVVPQLLGDITITSSGETTAQLTWTTDEFADSTVAYGTASGNYTETISDDQYVTAHAVSLTGLDSGVTYYYQVSSTDLSGNTWQSLEQSFTFEGEQLIYLPVVMR